MEPTIPVGSTVTVNRLAFRHHAVRAGDIIVFANPPSENCGGAFASDLIKRVIGLPGQTISLSGGYVFINGKRLHETWLPASVRGVTFPGPAGTRYDLAHPYRIPHDDYFVMGDNRADSCDSRYFGPIAKVLIVGKVVATAASTVAVPNAHGLTMTAANTLLSQSGLDSEAGSYDQTCVNGASPGDIDNSDPSVGSMVAAGSVVTIYPCQ